MTTRCALYMDALKIFGSLRRRRVIFPKSAFVAIDRIKVRTKFEVRSFTCS